MVEHRIARLVQVGIRQARYLGRTKTLFQVCLAAAVANLTLIAVTSDAVFGERFDGLGLVYDDTGDPAVSLSSLLVDFGLVDVVCRHRTHLDQFIQHIVPIGPALTPRSRPGFRSPADVG